MNESNKCPKCKKYILGTYCYGCDQDIRTIEKIEETFPWFNEIFGDKNNE